MHTFAIFQKTGKGFCLCAAKETGMCVTVVVLFQNTVSFYRHLNIMPRVQQL